MFTSPKLIPRSLTAALSRTLAELGVRHSGFGGLAGSARHPGRLASSAQTPRHLASSAVHIGATRPTWRPCEPHVFTTGSVNPHIPFFLDTRPRIGALTYCHIEPLILWTSQHLMCACHDPPLRTSLYTMPEHLLLLSIQCFMVFGVFEHNQYWLEPLIRCPSVPLLGHARGPPSRPSSGPLD